MHQDIRDIISKVYNGNSCRGLEGAAIATKVVADLFRDEGLDFNNWYVSEIPVADDSGKYPTAVAICIVNNVMHIGIEICVSADRLFCCACPGDSDIELDSIYKAINHSLARFKSDEETIASGNIFYGLKSDFDVQKACTLTILKLISADAFLCDKLFKAAMFMNEDAICEAVCDYIDGGVT